MTNHFRRFNCNGKLAVISTFIAFCILLMLADIAFGQEPEERNVVDIGVFGGNSQKIREQMWSELKKRGCVKSVLKAWPHPRDRTKLIIVMSCTEQERGRVNE